MTDEKPTAPLRATECEVEDCRVLIPATTEARLAHRRGHKHQEKVIEGWRNALKAANSKIDRLTGRVSDLEQDVEHIEIPEQLDPFAIVNPNDLEPLPDDPDEDDDEWEFSSPEHVQEPQLEAEPETISVDLPPYTAGSTSIHDDPRP